MHAYPLKRNRSQYYPKNGQFVMDAAGREVYAVDHRQNQVYPEGSQGIFARDEQGRPYYAKDCDGNEYYPSRGGKGSLVIRDGESLQRWRMAHYVDGSERYPRDPRGNEYYLQVDGKPFLLKDAKNESYLARNRKGIPLIPWNYLRDYTTDQPMLTVQDFGGNSVYMDESALPKAIQGVIKCICQWNINCPESCRTRCFG